MIARWGPRCGGVASRGYVTKAGRTRLCAYPCFGTEALGPGPVDGACDFLVNGIPAQAYLRDTRCVRAAGLLAAAPDDAEAKGRRQMREERFVRDSRAIAPRSPGAEDFMTKAS